MKFIPDEKKIHAPGIKEFDDALHSTVKSLAKIMEDLGNLINNRDAISPIDVRVGNVPFEIIILGMDDVEESYEDEEED